MCNVLQLKQRYHPFDSLVAHLAELACHSIKPFPGETTTQDIPTIRTKRRYQALVALTLVTKLSRA